MGNKTQLAETREFDMEAGRERVEMLGAVIVQKPRREAYRDRYEMQRNARLLALRAVLASLLVSIFAARHEDQTTKGADILRPVTNSPKCFPASNCIMKLWTVADTLTASKGSRFTTYRSG